MDFTMLGSFIEKFGLPMTMLVAFVWLVYTGKFVTGRELSDSKLLLEEKVIVLIARCDYTEERRKEEREARLLAETRLDKSLDLVGNQTNLLKDIERELTRIGALPPSGLR